MAAETRSRQLRRREREREWQQEQNSLVRSLPVRWQGHPIIPGARFGCFRLKTAEARAG